MADLPHILVIGAGLIGLSTADELLRRGARVTVLEAASEIMMGASFANSGMLHASQACSWTGSANDPDVDAAVHDLAVRSMALLDARMAEFGLTEARNRKSGCYQLFEDEDLADGALARMRSRGVDVIRTRSDIAPFGRPALYFPGDKSADAYLYGKVLAEAITARGGRIVTNQAVTQIKSHQGSGVEVVTRENRWRAKGLVVAGGTASQQLLEPHGIDVGVSAVRGWAIDFPFEGIVSVPDEPVMHASTRSALTKFKDRVRISGTWGAESEALLLSTWVNIAPDLIARLGTPTRIWSGLRPVSKKGRPIIGESGIKNIWIHAGHGHMGWTLCAGSADLLVDVMFSSSRSEKFSL